MKRAVKGFRAGPVPAAVRNRSEMPGHDDDHGVMIAAARKGNDTIVVWTAYLDRLVTALGEHVRHFIAELEEMPGPGELDMPVLPVLCESVPVRPLDPRQD